MYFPGLYHTGSLGRRGVRGGTMNITEIPSLFSPGAGAGQSPDSSLVFTFSIVGAVVQWVWQKQDWTYLVTLNSPQQSDSGYKKWPLPLVKHQRKTNYMQNNSPGQQTMMGGRFWPMRAQCCDWPDQWQDRKPCRPLECEGISWFSLSQLPSVKTYQLNVKTKTSRLKSLISLPRWCWKEENNFSV